MASDYFDQEKVYGSLMITYIEKLLSGYNINFMAYGQTGSGKTYTMIGPPNFFQNLPLELTQVLPEFGLFPRTAFNILNKVH